MTIENDHDLQALLRIGRICGETLQHMLAAVEPGMTTQELDAIGAAYLQARGARSAPILAYNFPGWTCISLNDEAAHGIPGPRAIRPGDVVNIDVSAELGGYWADTAGTLIVPPARPEHVRLLDFTQRALDTAILAARAGRRASVIGRAVEHMAAKGGYRTIRELTGHGVGRHIHEAPTVYNFENQHDPTRLREGMVLTIEPFLSLGNGRITTDRNRWTYRAQDGSMNAQVEHTVVITRGQPVLATAV